MGTATKFIASTVAAVVLAASVAVPFTEAQAQMRGGKGAYAAQSEGFQGNRGRNFNKRGFNKRGFNRRGKMRRAPQVRHQPRYVAPPVHRHVEKKRKKKNVGKWIAIGAGIAALAIIAGAASERRR